MVRKPEPPAPTTWDIFKAAAKLRPVGTVEAAVEAEAIVKAAARSKVIAGKLVRGAAAMMHRDGQIQPMTPNNRRQL